MKTLFNEVGIGESEDEKGYGGFLTRSRLTEDVSFQYVLAIWRLAING